MKQWLRCCLLCGLCLSFGACLSNTSNDTESLVELDDDDAAHASQTLPKDNNAPREIKMPMDGLIYRRASNKARRHIDSTNAARRLEELEQQIERERELSR